MVFVPFLDQDTPFKSWKLFNGRELGGFAKLRQRKQRFKEAESWLRNNSIDRIFIGNDRSVFGQFIIKTAKEKAEYRDESVTACFLDDGVFTYLGRPASKAWLEKYLDALVKKMMFGFWYNSPDTVGASKWIDEVWVMYPHYVNDSLKAKKIQPLDLTKSDLANMRTLAQQIVLNHDALLMDKLGEFDLLVALPNHRIFNKSPGYEVRIKDFIQARIAQGESVAVKYHPAAGYKDLLSIETLGCTLMPSALSFEVILTMLDKADFIGDLSTTTLLAHYFGQHSYFLPIVQSEQANKMFTLCKRLGVNVKF